MKGDKRINDPIHGSMAFDELETELINTKAFQRLKNVKQLGMAHHVYPSADYSRHAHSLGVCHIAKRFMIAIRDTDADDEVSVADEKNIRVAALLHDLGHYPFSHSYESAIEEMLEGDIEGVFKHERMSTAVLSQDDEITSIIERNPDLDLDVICRLIDSAHKMGRESGDSGEEPILANLVSSDLDVDRCDFLCRTAHMAGLRFGGVDLEFLISQAVCHDGMLVFNQKATSAIDHFLVGRFLEYGAVAFHKSVAGMECVLIKALQALMERGKLPYREQELKAMLTDKSWREFDDLLVSSLIRNELPKLGESGMQMRDALVWRKKPEQIAGFLFKRKCIQEPQEKESYETVQAEEQSIDATEWHEQQFSKMCKIVEQRVKDIVKADEPNVFFWSKNGTGITDSSRESVVEAEKTDEQTAGSPKDVRIFNGTDSNLLVKSPESLMHSIGGLQHYGFKVFCYPGHNIKDNYRNDIEAALEPLREFCLS